jgi:hypothetical protein
MKKKEKDIILYGIAGIFFLTFFFILFYFLGHRQYIPLFWICYTSMALITLGIVIKKPNLILSQAIILMVPDLLWTIDFFSILITGNSPFGLTTYFFVENRSLLQEFLSLQHFFAVPLAVWALSLMKIKKKENYKALLIGSIEISFFFLLGFILPAGFGVNCLPTPTVCTSVVFPKFIPYLLIWIILQFLFITISYFVITFLLLLIKKKISKGYNRQGNQSDLD